MSTDKANLTPAQLAEVAERADLNKMEQVRARADALVKDRDTAEALKPYYRQFCERPCFHDEYLDAFNRPNVTLEDTNGRGVEGITPTGVVANGVEHELDCLIYATGFEVGAEYARRASYDPVGPQRTDPDREMGQRRTHASRYARAWLSQLLLLHQHPVGLYGELSPHAQRAGQARRLHRQGKRRPAGARGTGLRERQTEWVETIKSLAVFRRKFLEECTPGNEGMPHDRSEQNGPYGAGPIAFVNVLEQWRAEGALKGLEIGRG